MITLRYYYFDRTYVYHKDDKNWGIVERPTLLECLKRMVWRFVWNDKVIMDEIKEFSTEKQTEYLLKYLEADRGKGVRVLTLINETTGEILWDYRN